MDDGRVVTREMVSGFIEDRKKQMPQGPALEKTVKLLHGLMTAREFPEFLTLATYDLLD